MSEQRKRRTKTEVHSFSHFAVNEWNQAKFHTLINMNDIHPWSVFHTLYLAVSRIVSLISAAHRIDHITTHATCLFSFFFYRPSPNRAVFADAYRHKSLTPAASHKPSAFIIPEIFKFTSAYVYYKYLVVHNHKTHRALPDVFWFHIGDRVQSSGKTALSARDI